MTLRDNLDELSEYLASLRVFRPDILLDLFLLFCGPSFFSLLSLLCLLSGFFSLFNYFSESDLPMDF
jgi:hypothetical protein